MPKAKPLDQQFADLSEQVEVGFERLTETVRDLVNPPRPPEPRSDETKMPRRLNWLTVARAAPGIFSEWDGLKTVVPEDFINLDADDAGAPVAVIACPCGATPSVGIAHSIACDCSRVFLNLGSEVRVYRPEEGETDPDDGAEPG